jgi:hypothetical protein
VMGDLLTRVLSQPQVRNAIVELLTPSITTAVGAIAETTLDMLTAPSKPNPEPVVATSGQFSLAGAVAPIAPPPQQEPTSVPTMYEIAGRTHVDLPTEAPKPQAAEDEHDDHPDTRGKPTILIAVPHTKYNEDIKRVVKKAARLRFWTLDKSVESLKSMAANCEMAVGVDGIHYTHREILRSRSPHYLGDATGVTRLRELLVRALVAEKAMMED